MFAISLFKNPSLGVSYKLDKLFRYYTFDDVSSLSSSSMTSSNRPPPPLNMPPFLANGLLSLNKSPSGLPLNRLFSNKEIKNKFLLQNSIARWSYVLYQLKEKNDVCRVILSPNYELDPVPDISRTSLPPVTNLCFGN